jgi:hypothetical protein
LSRVRHIFWSATFALAVNALPSCVGVTAGFAAYHSGSGEIGAILVGLIAGAFTFAAGQIAVAAFRSPLIRIAIALVFAVPAAIAGYIITQPLVSRRSAYPQRSGRRSLR